MKIDLVPKLDFEDVLIVPKTSQLNSRKEPILKTEYYFKNSNKTLEGIPILNSNMDTVGSFEMAKKMISWGLFSSIHKFYDVEEIVNFFNNFEDAKNSIFVSTGITETDKERLLKILDRTKINLILIDVANGYIQKFLNFISFVREKNPDAIIMAGNVVTPEGVENIIKAGADIVKIGIGNGSVCTTRKLTGVGYPQLSALLECRQVAKELNGYICSDGGIKCEGDFAKAFGAGADFVMAGAIFSGHIECCDDIILKDQNYYVKFRGMSSKETMEKYFKKVDDYRAPEGKEVLVPLKGSVDTTIKNILGGLRSSLTYVDAKSIKELYDKVEFVLVKRQLNDYFKT